MAEGIIYNPVLSKLISGLSGKEQAVLFEMEDGSMKSLNEVEDFHQVKTALKREAIEIKILNLLFGSRLLVKKTLKPKHFENFMTLFKVVLDHTDQTTLKKVSARFNLSIHKGDEGGKILSERLRE